MNTSPIIHAVTANAQNVRRTRVVGAFPAGQSCLNLAAARLRHIAGTNWSTRKYMNMQPSHEKGAKDSGHYHAQEQFGDCACQQAGAHRLEYIEKWKGF